eukprot:jgi/Psemu1/179605/e_gw1.10.93.1
MPTAPSASNRPGFGDRTQNHASFLLNTAGSISKGKTLVENDEDTQQPTKMKRADVFSVSTWDEVASDCNKRNTTSYHRHVSIVSPAYTDECFEDDEEFDDVEEHLIGKPQTSFNTTVSTTITTSETESHAKAVASGYVFSDALLETSARKVLRPLEGESIEDAIANMKKICLKAMKNGGEDWKSIVEDEDKYNLLLSNSKVRSQIVFKSLVMVGILDVMSATISNNLPPAVMRSCELGRSKAMKWIGHDESKDFWIPKTITVYQWYREFTNGRFFRHPERARHTEMQVFERLDAYFSENPAKIRAFKSHIRSVLKQQRVFIHSRSDDGAPSSMVRDGTLGGNAYDFYCYFVNNILRDSSDKSPVIKQDANERGEEVSAEDYAKFLAAKQYRLASFGFQSLTWQHLNVWMDRKWAKSRHISDSS